MLCQLVNVYQYLPTHMALEGLNLNPFSYFFLSHFAGEWRALLFCTQENATSHTENDYSERFHGLSQSLQ